MTVPQTIGFIGLGLMGSAMVQRLQACGYDLTVIAHRNRVPIEAAVGRRTMAAPMPPLAPVTTAVR